MAGFNETRLEIGDSILIARGILRRTSLLYAGMPGENVFSLVVTVTAGHTGLAYNLYLPTDQRQVHIAGRWVSIEAVSPADIRLSVR